MESTFRQPRIPGRFLIVPAEPGGFRLHSESRSFSLADSADGLLARLLPLLDGKRQTADLLAELSSFEEGRVLAALDELTAAGLLEEGTPPADGRLSPAELDRYASQVSFFSHFAATTEAAPGPAWPDTPRTALEYQERLKAATVVLAGLGRTGSRLARALAQAGLGRIVALDDRPVGAGEVDAGAWFTPEQVGRPRAEAIRAQLAAANPWVELAAEPRSIADLPADELAALLSPAVLAILCHDHLNPSDYETFNLACHRAGTTWTSCRPFGFEVQVGPTVIPGQTACYTCFDLRRKSNLTDYEEYLLLERAWRSRDVLPTALNLAPGVELVALEAVKIVGGFVEPATYGRLYSLNLLTMESRFHPVLKVPRCPTCGLPSRDRPTIQLWASEPS